MLSYVLMRIHTHILDLRHLTVTKRPNKFMSVVLWDTEHPWNEYHPDSFIVGNVALVWTLSWCPSIIHHEMQTSSFHATQGIMGRSIWSSHWRSTRTNQGLDFYSVASFLLYKYILIYVKRFIFVSVICVSVTIKVTRFIFLKRFL